MHSSSDVIMQSSLTKSLVNKDLSNVQLQDVLLSSNESIAKKEPPILKRMSTARPY